MNLFSKIVATYHQRKEKKVESFEKMDFFNDTCATMNVGGDSYRLNAWVNIAVTILIRNIAWADFVVERGGNEVTSGPLFILFRRPNKALSRYDLWKETAGWWFLEGEAFWFFGTDYAGMNHVIYCGRHFFPREVKFRYGNILVDCAFLITIHSYLQRERLSPDY
jgi:hypothetical protein